LIFKTTIVVCQIKKLLYSECIFLMLYTSKPTRRQESSQNGQELRVHARLRSLGQSCYTQEISKGIERESTKKLTGGEEDRDWGTEKKREKSRIKGERCMGEGTEEDKERQVGEVRGSDEEKESQTVRGKAWGKGDSARNRQSQRKRGPGRKERLKRTLFIQMQLPADPFHKLLPAAPFLQSQLLSTEPEPAAGSWKSFFF